MSDYPGQATPYTLGSPYNAIDFMVRQIIAGKAYAALVMVLSVTGGGISGPATVSVQPMVNQQDNAGTQVPHGTVHNLPVHRPQGGAFAFIADPVAGDIGLAVMCDRDISTVKTTGAPGPAGSFRTNSWSDGLYLGAFLGAAPTGYVWVREAGIDIVTAGTVTVKAGGDMTLISPTVINLNAPVLKNNGTPIVVP